MEIKVKRQTVTITGIITGISASSGLIKRCMRLRVSILCGQERESKAPFSKKGETMLERG
jgi:hypothetical protein